MLGIFVQALDTYNRVWSKKSWCDTVLQIFCETGSWSPFFSFSMFFFATRIHYNSLEVQMLMQSLKHCFWIILYLLIYYLRFFEDSRVRNSAFPTFLFGHVRSVWWMQRPSGQANLTVFMKLCTHISWPVDMAISQYHRNIANLVYEHEYPSMTDELYDPRLLVRGMYRIYCVGWNGMYSIRAELELAFWWEMVTCVNLTMNGACHFFPNSGRQSSEGILVKLGCSTWNKDSTQSQLFFSWTIWL